LISLENEDLLTAIAPHGFGEDNRPQLTLATDWAGVGLIKI
jgi:hypothetical protein